MEPDSTKRLGPEPGLLSSAGERAPAGDDGPGTQELLLDLEMRVVEREDHAAGAVRREALGALAVLALHAGANDDDGRGRQLGAQAAADVARLSEAARRDRGDADDV